MAQHLAKKTAKKKISISPRFKEGLGNFAGAVKKGSDYAKGKIEKTSFDHFQGESIPYGSNTVRFLIGAAVLTCVIALIPVSVMTKSFLYILPCILAGLCIGGSVVRKIRVFDLYNSDIFLILICIGLLCSQKPVFAPAAFILYIAAEALYTCLNDKYTAGKIISAPSADAVYDVKTENGFAEMPVSEIQPDSIVAVNAGAVIPLDGYIVSGTSAIDRSGLMPEKYSFTGCINDKVYRGDVNVDSDIEIRTSAVLSDCAAEILTDRRSITESRRQLKYNAAIKWGRAFLVASALILILVSVFFHGKAEKIQGIGLVLCAFSYTASRAVALMHNVCRAVLKKNGIYVFNENALTGAADCDIAAFDKTGVLTDSLLDISAIKPYRIPDDALLHIAAAAESHSVHPVAVTLRRICPQEYLRAKSEVLEEYPGMGISSMIDGHQVYVGNAALMALKGIPVPIPTFNGITVFVAINNSYAGRILFTEKVKESAADAVEAVRAYGASQTVMFTGSSLAASKALARSLDFDMVKCDLLPEKKAAALDFLMENKKIGSSLIYAFRNTGDATVEDHADICISVDSFSSGGRLDNSDVISTSTGLAFLDVFMSVSRKLKRIFTYSVIALLAADLAILLLCIFGLFSAGISVVIHLLLCVAALFYAASPAYKK